MVDLTEEDEIHKSIIMLINSNTNCRTSGLAYLDPAKRTQGHSHQHSIRLSSSACCADATRCTTRDREHLFVLCTAAELSFSSDDSPRPTAHRRASNVPPLVIF